MSEWSRTGTRHVCGALGAALTLGLSALTFTSAASAGPWTAIGDEGTAQTEAVDVVDAELAIVPDTLVSVVPARFTDTRLGESTIDGLFASEGKRAADSEYDITIAGRGAVPADAEGVVVNVTAVNPDAQGYVTLHPCVAPRPVASSLNYVAGVNVGNELVAALSADGKICAYTNQSTHLTIDVVGYVPAGSQVAPLVPARLLDTRSGEATIDGAEAGAGRTAAGSTTTVDVAGRGGVPAADVHAVLINVTAVSPLENGFVVAYACLPSVPATSSLNHVANVNRGNELLVELDANGDICVYTERSLHLVADVVGYIPVGSTVATTAPSRLADSRPGKTTVDGLDAGFGKQAAGTEHTVQITGRAGVPADAKAAVVNVTTVAPETNGFFTVHPCAAPRPVASSLNFTAGVNGGNELIAGLSPGGELCVYTSTTAHFTVDVVGYLANSAAPQADLGITKSDSVDPIVAGNTLAYTLEVDNAGPADAENVVVTDTLPAGVTFVSTTGCNNDPVAVPACELGSVASGTSKQFTIEVTVDITTGGSITNSATVTSDTGDPAGSNNVAEESTDVIAVGTIIIEKTTEPSGGTGFLFSDDIEAPNTFTLDDGESKTFANIPPGSYEVTESDPSPQNLTSINCDDGASSLPSTGSTATGTASIGLDAGETVTCTFANNINLAPAITSDGGAATAAVNATENQTAVTDVDATDDFSSEGAGLAYSVTGGIDQALFSIDATTGVLAFAAAPDFDSPGDAGADNVFDVQVTVADAGPGPTLTDVQDIAVTVTDLNENPVITSDGGGATATANAPENQTEVTTVTASDPDVPAQTLTFSITGGADQALLGITAGGVLTFDTAPDFDAPSDAGGDNVYDVQVTVTDDGVAPLTDVQDIAITVTNENESPVITSDGGGATAIVGAGENQTAVTTVAATDPDVPAQTLTFSITGGADQALFGIVGSPGVLTFNSAPDFDVPGDAGGDNVYDVQVTVTDDGLPNLTDVQDIAVTVTDVNENPVITSDGGGATASVNAPENQTAVTTVTASDPDVPAQSLTYSISGGADQALFGIVGATGVLTLNTARDFENTTDAGANGVYDVQVTVTDNGTGSLTDVQDIAVTVTDVNEAPVISSYGGLASGTDTVQENATLVENIDETDEDLPAQTMSYTITGGADSAVFGIQTATGILVFNSGPDFENPTDVGGNNVYDVQVTVTDNGVPNLTDVVDIAVTVTDVNEAPLITSNGGGATAAVDVDENTTAVTTVTSTDEDLPAQTLTATITGGADQLLFGVTAGGVLTFNAAPDFENPTDAGPDGVYDVQVTVTDNGVPNLTDVQDIAVTVTDVDPETPPSAVDDPYAATGNVSMTVAAANGVLGNDTGPTLVVTEVQGVAANVGTATDTTGTGLGGVKGSVTVAADGSFTYRPPPGFVGADTFTYEVTNGAGSDTGTVTITAADVIWFVDNSSTGADRGTLADPFTSFTSLNAAQGATSPNPTDGQTIFVDTGSGDYTDGATLRMGQKLIGEASSVPIATAAGITVAPFSDSLPTTSGAAPVLTDATAGADGIDLSSNNLVRGLDIGNTGGVGLNSTANAGTLTVSEVAISGTGGGVDILGGGSDAINVVLDDLSSNSATEYGIRLQSVGGTFSVVGSTGTVTTAAVPAVEVISSSTSVTYNGTVVANTTTANGINLTNNTGTITLGGRLDIDSTSGTGFNATGGGTVVANGANSDINTTTGIGVNVVDTTIGGPGPAVSSTGFTGAFGLTFQSVSVGTGTTGPANGIVLDNAGDGGFTITGSGADGSGGTLQDTTSDAIVLLNGTTNVELTNIVLDDVGRHGVFGTGAVTNLVVNNSQFTDIGDAVDEKAFSFDSDTATPLEPPNIAGQLTLNDVDITRFFDNGLNIYAESGSVNVDVINGSDFTDGADFGTGPAKGQAIIVETEGTAGADLNVNGSLFDDVESDAVRLEAGGSGTNNADVIGNIVTDPGGLDNDPNGGSFHMIVTDAATLSFDIQGNTQNDLPGDGIIVAATSGGGNISGRIGGALPTDGNTINGGVDPFGFPVTDGILVSDIGVDATVAETMVLLIQNNTIDAGGGDDGIQFSVGDNDGDYNVTIRDNDISNTGSEGIRFFFDDDFNQSPTLDLDVIDNHFMAILDGSIELATRDSAVACANFTGNDNGAGGSPGTILFDEANSSIISVPQASEAAISTANSGASVTNIGLPLTFNTTCTTTLPSHT